MLKVAILDDYQNVSHEFVDLKNLSGKYEFKIFSEPFLDEADTIEQLSDFEALLIMRERTPITKNLIDSLKDLKFIITSGMRNKSIDLEAAKKRRIIVSGTEINTNPTAELTWTLILGLARNVKEEIDNMYQGYWQTTIGLELKDKILGIVGLGKIGREVMKRALSYDMKILGYDPFVNQEKFNPDTIQIVELDNLITSSDYISLHVPLIDSTKNLFDLKQLKKMKKTARIINVARGGIINEKDLSTALNNDIIAGAAIDVFEHEPLDPNSALISSKNILLTPHLGASTYEAKEGVSMGICQQVRDYLVDEKLANPINMPITDMAKLKALTPYLDLAKILGKIHNQLCNGPIKSIALECYGDIEDTKPIILSFLIGLLENITDVRLNFVNVGIISKCVLLE